MNQTVESKDIIRVNDLLLTVPLRHGARWAQSNAEPVLQPILVTLSIAHDLRRTALTDDLAYSINYASICSTLCQRVTSNDVTESLEALSKRIFDLVFGLEDQSVIQEVHLKVLQIKAPLHCKTIGVDSIAKVGNGHAWGVDSVRHFCEDIKCQAVVGVNACEREVKQVVRLDISIENPTGDLERSNWLDFPVLIRRLYINVNKSSYLTLEALVSYVALETLRHLRPSSGDRSQAIVTIEAAKPSALVFASSAAVKICRTFTDFRDEFVLNQEGNDVAAIGNSVPETSIASVMGTEPIGATTHFATVPQKKDENQAEIRYTTHTAAIALGSNLGDRFYNIELALRLLEVPQDVLFDSATAEEDDKAGEEPKQEMTVTVVDTSFLYTSSPMYVTDQPTFVNCIETNLRPLTLLRLLKKIETAVGRVPSIRNGPRAVDLDILLYDDAVIDTRPLTQRIGLENLQGQLVVPHPRMVEREFVLRPLNDIMPDYVHPVLHKSIFTLLAELELAPEDPPMQKVIPFPRYPVPAGYPLTHPSVSPVPPTLTFWTFPADSMNEPSQKAKTTGHKPHLMGTLNATPDSFSDGSTHNTLPTALAYARGAVSAGASIIDVGGYSTRPGAAFVEVEEEVERVVPIIRAMRRPSLPAEDEDGRDEGGVLQAESAKKEDGLVSLWDMPISIDTFRWDVARAAILAGANCINDVYAFTGPDSYPYPPPRDNGKYAEESMGEMKRVAREFAVPVVLMHSRGDAGMNKDYGVYDYASVGRERGVGAVIEGVQVELGQKVDHIIMGKGGVRRWFVIVDPGIGFSKTLEGNLEVLRGAKQITAHVDVGQENGGVRKRNPLLGYPMLIGVSKKSFLGAILAQGEVGRSTEPQERSWATAAAVACAVQQGAMVVRVHDTKEMGDVVRVADALWGLGPPTAFPPGGSL